MKKPSLFNLLAKGSLLIILVTIIMGLSQNSSALVDLTPDKFKPIETTALEHNGAILQFALQTDKSEYVTGENIEIDPQIVNTGTEPITIVHAHPPFIITIYDQNNKTVWEYPYPILDIGYEVTLEPHVPYAWTKEKLDESYKIKLNSTGTYNIMSYASFGLNEEDVDPLQSWHLYSEPLKISVKSNVIQTPLKQFESGTSLGEIQCREGLELLLKTSNNHPICVKPETKTKLVERGWAKPV